MIDARVFRVPAATLAALVRGDTEHAASAQPWTAIDVHAARSTGWSATGARSHSQGQESGCDIRQSLSFGSRTPEGGWTILLVMSDEVAIDYAVLRVRFPWVGLADEPDMPGAAEAAHDSSAAESIRRIPRSAASDSE